MRMYLIGSNIIQPKVGPAAVLFWGNAAPKSLRYHLGSLDEHTTFEAEAVGLIMGAHLLSMEPHPALSR